MNDPGLDEFYRFRRELVARVRTELIGPVDGDHEVLREDPPMTTYVAGVLYPKKLDPSFRGQQSAERDEDLADSTLEYDEQSDNGIALANIQAPASAGLSFAVDPAVTTEITVHVEAAVYQPRDAEGEPVEARRGQSRASEGPTEHWHRRPLDLEAVTVDVSKPGDERVELVTGLQLRTRVRPEDGGAVAVTVTLVNVKETKATDFQDAHCFYQVGLTVTGPAGTEPFVERSRGADVDMDTLLGSLLYRHAPIFAVGHGCAVVWERNVAEFAEDRNDAGSATAYEIRTDFAPSADVRLTRSNPDINAEDLGMTSLGTWPRARVVRSLNALLDQYEVWIEELAVDAERLSGSRFEDLPLGQVRQCREALKRMRTGVALLADESDPAVFEAFQLANRTMASQRSRTQWIKDGRSGEIRDSGSWRPFQIGFILVNLCGIADPEHADRSTVDVLWFPTGGGKTEAYLGLIAFSVFLRRLRHGELGGGVTVIMRYTLRLLTLQQFERAATLICAMETFRRGDPTRLGSEPISIAMWVGRAATPNSFKEAAASIRKLRKGEDLHEQNPVQLRSCPWCGSPLDAEDYEVNTGNTGMTISCRAEDCEFHAALPVHVVDRGIYDHRPTLVIATSDKFAQIAWRGEVASLFNRDGAPAGTPPPELVIQDELHLISGPLGTLAGLYETAIDLAAGHPKIIASTATIRRAREQAGALFDRDVAQFPPSGLDARDSWFATEAAPEHLGARMFLGLMAPNLSQASLLVRTYGALFHHAAIVAGEDRVRDPYWTLIGYFNSLRLLAAAELQVHDDVRRNIELLANRDGVSAREIELTSELTSRVKSSDIPMRLKDLERALPDEPLDAVLATNMISVGVDVDRLGLMAVMGQPQMTAEYIQATSRVGRRYPGLAVVLYNSARSRDRSHYENFAGYHGALYRQVESTSVTPFAARARDRALHAAFVGAARMLIRAARLNGAAGQVEGFVDELDELRARFTARVRRVDKGQADATDSELEKIIGEWRELAAVNSDLVYEAPLRDQYKPQKRLPDTALLCSYSDDDLDAAWPTLWSLRDVDVETDLYLGS
jgi:hypothetical protein